MAPLTILPRTPDRGAAYAGVLAQIIGTFDQNRQAAEAARGAQEDQQTQRVKAALSPYAAQPQLLTRALQMLTPEDRQRAQRIGIGVVQPMESPEQILDRTRATAQTNDITGNPAPPTAAPAATPSQPDAPPIGGEGAESADLSAPPPATASPSPNDVVDAKVRQFEAIYKHAPAKEQVDQWFQAALLGQQGQVTAAQVAAKIVPTAQENITNAANERTFTEITKPKTAAELVKSAAETANINSQKKYRDTVQTPNTQATTAHTRASTVKTDEEIKALRRSNDPVIRTTMARSLVDGVLQDPQSFYALPTEDKKLVVGLLHRAPSKLAASEVEQINASENGLNLLKDTRAIVDKWAKRGVSITGPVLGRYEEATNTFGDGIMPPQLSGEMKTEFAQDISKMHEWLTVLPILEAKGLVGSRPAKEVIARVATVTPSLSKATDFFDGAMAGTQQRLEERQKTLTAKQWGGRPPVLDGGTANPSDLKSKSNADLFKIITGPQ